MIEATLGEALKLLGEEKKHQKQKLVRGQAYLFEVVIIPEEKEITFSSIELASVPCSIR